MVLGEAEETLTTTETDEETLETIVKVENHTRLQWTGIVVIKLYMTCVRACILCVSIEHAVGVCVVKVR